MTSSDHTARATAPTLDDIARDQHRDIPATVRAECQHLQALEDAIAYRRARFSAQCPDCTADGHMCDDHACDLDLIAAYQRTAIAILNASSQTDASRGTTSPALATKPSAPSQASPEPPCQRMRPPAARRKTQALAIQLTVWLASHRSCPDPAAHAWTGGRDE
jgi:hypothetical protein